MGLVLREKSPFVSRRPHYCDVSKTEQPPRFGDTPRDPTQSLLNHWKPRGFNRALADLLDGSIDTELSYEVLEQIDRKDARRSEVVTFCTRLAFAELHAVLSNEYGAELKDLAGRKRMKGELRIVETDTASRGGRDLSKVLSRKESRDFGKWRAELLRRYAQAISKKLDCQVEFD